MCWWATKRICRRGWAFRGRRLRPNRSWTPSVFFGMIDKVVKKHPQAKVVATTLREVHSTNRHSWSAVAWIDGKTYYRADGWSWTWWIAWAAATALRPGLSMGC